MYKVVLLCGGRGSRLNSETNDIPKPMVTIGSIPILFHLMKIYLNYNFNDFILCLGYKQEIIRNYFLNFHLNNSDITINLKNNIIKFLKKYYENINISLIDTGETTLTGGRLLKIRDYIQDDLFLVNYSDGLADINIEELIKFHKSHGKIATLTGVRKKGKFGVLQLENNLVTEFKEKPLNDYINGGFFVFSKKIFDYLTDGDLPDTLQLLAKQNQLMVYKFNKEWLCLDTLSDKIELENRWKDKNVPWF